MNLDDHKTRKDKKPGQARFVSVYWARELDEDEYWRFEKFVKENTINPSSFIRALIKEFLDNQEDE